LDSDPQDGLISQEEFQRVYFPWLEHHTVEVFRLADTDDDDKLTEDEYDAWQWGPNVPCPNDFPIHPTSGPVSPRTTLASAAYIGNTTIVVASTDGLEVGQSVRIGDPDRGSVTEKAKIIQINSVLLLEVGSSSTAPGTIVLDQALSHDYSTQDPVVVIATPAPQPPITEPPATIPVPLETTQPTEPPASGPVDTPAPTPAPTPPPPGPGGFGGENNDYVNNNWQEENNNFEENNNNFEENNNNRASFLSFFR
jgi:hypothetical protein